MTETARVALLVITSERKFYLNLLAAGMKLTKLEGVDLILIADTSLWERRTWGERYLRQVCSEVEIIKMPGLSFHRTLHESWRHLAEDCGVTHVIMFEEDFVPVRHIPVASLISLANESRVLQIIMPRQKWFEAERAFPTRSAYLRSRHNFVTSRDGDRLSRFFTSNPNCMRLDRLIPITQSVELSDSYEWELQYASVVEKSGLVALHLASKRPWVIHVGAATSKGVRDAIEHGRTIPLVYLRAHLKRALVVAQQGLRRFRF